MTHPKRGNAGPRSIVWGAHSCPPNLTWIRMPQPNPHLAEAGVSGYRRSKFDSIHIPNPTPKAPSVKNPVHPQGRREDLQEITRREKFSTHQQNSLPATLRSLLHASECNPFIKLREKTFCATQSVLHSRTAPPNTASRANSAAMQLELPPMHHSRCSYTFAT
jgi:hypothetical protein